jgi:hypothetical protein
MPMAVTWTAWSHLDGCAALLVARMNSRKEASSIPLGCEVGRVCLTKPRSLFPDGVGEWPLGFTVVAAMLLVYWQ